MARRKGFSIKLTLVHWLSLQQTYEWARNRGLMSEEMNEIAALLPNPVPNEDTLKAMAEHDDAAKHLTGRELERNRYHHHNLFWGQIRGVKTVRIRAFNADKVIAFLDTLSALSGSAVAASAISSRACKLRKLGPMELLADAGR